MVEPTNLPAGGMGLARLRLRLSHDDLVPTGDSKLRDVPDREWTARHARCSGSGRLEIVFWRAAFLEHDVSAALRTVPDVQRRGFAAGDVSHPGRHRFIGGGAIMFRPAGSKAEHGRHLILHGDLFPDVRRPRPD